MKTLFLISLWVGSIPVAATHAATIPNVTSTPDKISASIADRQDSLTPNRVQLGGVVGARVLGNEAIRLANVDTGRLLEGYRHRPGRQTWDGEHVGKWLHAATLAWANTGDPVLREKLTQTATELCRCQEADGYLGTYLEKDRWSAWDVWAHKYNLIGLLTYMRYTGDQSPLPTCRRMADLLCRSFGDGPGQLDIIASGHHNGMAATSVLEPMVLLYRTTGDERYLDFCRYIVSAWEHPKGPHIISRLLELKRVDKVGNAKAYEMLSCLNGALEFYRVTGEKPILEACLNAWKDIVDHRLYLTGTASSAEYFRDDHDLPNRGNVGETCVTVTWLQFNAHLLRITGEARFAEQLEVTVMNQLFGAQQPDCKAWGYYVEMEGRKPYSVTLDANCCLSSGPRGVALIPTFTLGTDDDGVVLNLYSPTDARVQLRDGLPVTVAIHTAYPNDGAITISLSPAEPREFTVKFRKPQWCEGAAIRVNDEPVTPLTGSDGYASVRRTWRAGDQINLVLPLASRVIVGDHGNRGKVAFAHGPLILAADASRLTPQESLASIAIVDTDTGKVIPAGVTHAGTSDPTGFQSYRLRAVARDDANPTQKSRPVEIDLLPFAEAGGTGAAYRVWLPIFGAPHFNVATMGTESRSRSIKSTWGNPGSLIDESTRIPVVAEDGKSAALDWFCVTLPAVTQISQIIFYHGAASATGGWFDASTQQPRIEVQPTEGSSWEPVGVLSDYPATTATSAGTLTDAQRFELRLAKPSFVKAVRVIGVPACGQQPAQNRSSCAELQIFAD